MGLILDGASTLLEMRANEEEFAAKQAQSKENILLAEAAAADASQRGALEAGTARTEGTKLQAAQRVAYANSGVDMSVGTPAAVMAETAAVSEYDAKMLENNAAREAWGFKKQVQGFQREMEMDKRRMAYKRTGTVLTGLSRGVQTTSSAIGMGKGFK